MTTRICSVSVDLDPVSCYHRIHDLPIESGPDPVYARALPRLLDLFEELSIRATFFVIGRDLAVSEHVELLREAAARGHELANHSQDHPYNLPALHRDQARHQIEACHDALREKCDVECVGFRAPGYNIDERTIEILDALGYEYDSSIFPCPPYYLAKAAVMASIRLRGGRSDSAMVPARTQLAPLTPYRPRPSAVHRRARAAHDGLMELPMCVLPLVRAPVIGTSLVLAGPRGASAMIRGAALRHRQFLNLELHGIDLIDADLDGIDEALRERQPDLRYDLGHKLATFRSAFRRARRLGYRFVTCRDAAAALA